MQRLHTANFFAEREVIENTNTNMAVEQEEREGEPPNRVMAPYENRKKFAELQRRVHAVVNSSSVWERKGEDLTLFFGTIFCVMPVGLLCLRSDSIPVFAFGLLCMGFTHHSNMVKGAHMFGHSVYELPWAVNQFFRWFTIELVGAFPESLAVHGHIQVHHPHTNIIGLGDSSTWRIPFLSRYTYMFLAPLMLGPLTPIVGMLQIWGRWRNMLTYAASLILGLGTHYALLCYVSGLESWGAFMCMWASRAVFMIPYIHVNIFQHIGLNMYTTENRPDRLTLMSTSVLNLPRHPVLDWCFGHSIINCHIEHHLFPTLSDAMCLKVKPVVQQFFAENGLAYHEKTYVNRMFLFIKKYEKLMVHAPPITEFIAVQ